MNSLPLEKKPFPPRYLPITLRILRYAITLSVAFFVGIYGETPFQFLCLFSLVVFIVLFVPYLISFAIRREYRFIFHTVGVVVLGGLVGIALLDLDLSDHAMEKLVQNMSNELKLEQRDNVPVDPSQIEARIQQLKTQAGQSNTPEASILSALASLGLELVDKVKAGQAAEEAAGDYNPALLTSRDAVTFQIKSFSTLRTKQADVLTLLQNFYEHIRTVLAGEGINNNDITDLIARTKQGRDLGPFINLQQSKIKLTTDRLTQLTMLEKNWGKWQTRNGEIVFANSDLQKIFAAQSDTIQEDMRQIEAPQK